MQSSFEDSESENKTSEEEICTEKEVHETKTKLADDEIINSKISTGNKTTSEQLLLAYNVHPPQAYSVHPPQAKEQQNNPLSSSSSTIPYSVKENNSKKRRVVHGQCTQSKKPKIVDPKLSLPEESDMDNKIGDLLYNDNLNESDDDSTLKDDNEDFDDMLQGRRS